MDKEYKPLVLKKVREEQGYTLRSLAKEIGVHYSLISYWEYGKKKPRTANRNKLEKALGVNANELFKELEEGEKDE